MYNTIGFYFNVARNLIGEVIDQFTVNTVSGSNLNGVEVVHNVRLHHNQLGNTVNHNRILQRHQVEPTATTRTTCYSTELVTDTAQLLTYLVKELCGERTAANPCGVCLPWNTGLRDMADSFGGAENAKADEEDSLQHLYSVCRDDQYGYLLGALGQLFHYILYSYLRWCRIVCVSCRLPS